MGPIICLELFGIFLDMEITRCLNMEAAGYLLVPVPIPMSSSTSSSRGVRSSWPMCSATALATSDGMYLRPLDVVRMLFSSSSLGALFST